jgi:dihydrofolate reductase
MFKAKTLGKPIIMGRKTHESIGKVLPGRLNIVLSRGAWVGPAFDNQDHPLHARSLHGALTVAMLTGAEEIFIIGGGQVYEEAMPLADRIYLTRVDQENEGDAHFPAIDLDQWRMTSCEGFAKVGGRPAYQFQVWDRI